MTELSDLKMLLTAGPAIMVRSVSLFHVVFNQPTILLPHGCHVSGTFPGILYP